MVEPMAAVSARYETAQLHFAMGDYITAAQELEPIAEAVPEDVSVRLLLARSYYHSAQLHRAEAEASAVLASDPANAYAYLLLGRTLERQSRHAEAGGPLRMAAAMGVDR